MYFLHSGTSFLYSYSVLKALTGSLLLAILAGISPAIIVRNILIKTNIIPACQGKKASTFTPVTDIIILLIGIVSNTVTPIPISPDTKPVMKVSALNTLEISFLDAPIALKIPISFVLSNTEIYVIIPIIIDETINDIATNAINT